MPSFKYVLTKILSLAFVILFNIPFSQVSEASSSNTRMQELSVHNDKITTRLSGDKAKRDGGDCHLENSRTRFQRYFVEKGQRCLQEEQRQSCSSDEATWSGTYEALTCHEVSGFSSVVHLPLFHIEQLRYKGGFRTSGRNFAKGKGNSLNYSGGIIAYNAKNHSIFIVGHPHSSSIAELKIPELVKSANISDFNVASELLQNFTKFNNTKRVDTGIRNHFRVTGLGLVGDGLMVNYIDWYDAGGNETDTTIYFKDASNLTTSNISGPFQLNGAAHSAGWISAIPSEWQKSLGGTFISGSQANASIISRRSVGPSAFITDPLATFLTRENGDLAANGLLDFPLSNLLYDKSVYTGKVYPDDILRNKDGRNKLWTFLSGAGYGFIIPGTSTYMTIGGSGGHKFGVGYKITQENGRLCGGYCANSSTDRSGYYWLWDVKELLKVKLGLLKSYDVRPYDYGEFTSPLANGKFGVGGAAFDPNTGLLYLSSPQADQLKKYSRPPLILVYEIFNGK
ncbi:hypothetical protein [Paraglaciecola polaris]|uniref:hypothetical protein n=1 Tax=Paraglaciecola polaris TaxID=222814 RepID=UPI0030EE39AF|tara:strand:- start:13323 stop:14855 length:1533 start_codon:yes stop_codon:yes gene_type:complete